MEGLRGPLFKAVVSFESFTNVDWDFPAIATRRLWPYSSTSTNVYVVFKPGIREEKHMTSGAC